MANWKDATSYSRGDKDRTPTVLEINLGAYRLVVMSSHIYYPGKWVMTLRPLIESPFELNVETLEEAKVKAIEYTKELLTRTTNEAFAKL